MSELFHWHYRPIFQKTNFKRQTAEYKYQNNRCQD